MDLFMKIEFKISLTKLPTIFGKG